MGWEPPQRSGWVESLNALGRGRADGGRSLVPLDEDSVLAGARRATGLEDYGDGWFREPLRVLLEALEDEARLTLLGRLTARAEIARVLESRLRVVDHLSRHPGIEDQEVAEPVFVTGLARTGTSLLHELLALDPAHRVPMLWEMMYPVPPPEPDAVASDPRVARAHAEITFMERTVPAIRTMHELAGDQPNECIYLFAHELASDLFSGFFRVPSYSMWMARADLAPAYAAHRRLLKLLQWRHRRERWVLKAPSHLSRLATLFRTYPDARVVLTHRDPLRVLGSLADLMATLHWMRSDEVDYDGIVRALALGHALHAERVVSERESGGLPADRILDVRYLDLVADPVTTLGRLYEQCGWDFPDALADRVAAWVASRPQGRHGAHEYAFADTGLDVRAERARFRRYQERFDVPSEV